jgi:hypothetical protein
VASPKEVDVGKAREDGAPRQAGPVGLVGSLVRVRLVKMFPRRNEKTDNDAT